MTGGGRFNRDVVQAKLASIRELLHDLAAIGPVDGERLERDRIVRHAVERILTQIVELAAGINGHAATTLLGTVPGDYRESFALASRAGLLGPALATSLQPSAGLRNLLIHEYARIDLDVVAAASATAAEQYGAYVRQVAAYLDRTRA